MQRTYSYLCLYSKGNGDIQVLIAKKLIKSYWFDSCEEEYNNIDEPYKIRDNFCKVDCKYYRCHYMNIDNDYYAIYPEGFPLENGAGLPCLVGGEVKGTNASFCALREFKEETGYDASSLQIRFSLSRLTYTVVYIEVTSEHLANIVASIKMNLTKAITVDTEKMKNKEFNDAPTVASNELESVHVLTIDESITMFERLGTSSDWFVEALVSIE